MRAATVHDLKRELKLLSREEVIELCLRMAKHKKDSKELLSFLLFEANDEAGWIRDVKHELGEELEEINTGSIYWAKKSVQKVARKLTKYLRYTNDPETKVELLLWFCETLNDSHIRLRASRVLMNLYNRQLTAIDKTMARMHEDLQYDYAERRAELRDLV